MPLKAALRLPRMIVYYSPWTHRPSVSEHKSQGWIMNWMTGHLAAYEFRELESTERFDERIFWTNHFNEQILEIQYSKKNCRSHHYLRLLSGSTDQGSDMVTHYALCMMIWVKITGGISAYNLMMMAHFSVTSAPFCSIQTMWVAISTDDCLTHFGGVKITYPYRKDKCIYTVSIW